MKNGEPAFLLSRDVVKSTVLSKNIVCEGKSIFDNHWSKVDSNSNFQLLHR